MVLKALKELGYQVSLFGSTLATDLPWERSGIDYLQGEMGIPVYLYQHDWLDALFLEHQARVSPDNWNQYNPPWFLDAFRNLFHRIKPDLVVVEYAWWGKLAIGDEFKSATRVIISLDSLTINERMQQALRPHLETPIDPRRVSPEVIDEEFFTRLQLEEKIAGVQEYQIYDEYDATIAFSAYDERVTRRNTERTWVHHIPITYPVESVENTYRGDPLLVISNYSLNYQGYAYFSARVLPKILQEQPDFNLQVIGKACENVLPADGTQLLGFVPELKPYYADARFAICPVIGGTGMQVKIVEAMAHGVPVVALKNIAHSAPIEHGVNGFIAQDAEEFAAYSKQLNRDPALCRKKGQAARETIRESFSPKIQAQKWQEAIAAAEENRLKRLGGEVLTSESGSSSEGKESALHPQIRTYAPRKAAGSKKRGGSPKRSPIPSKKSGTGRQQDKRLKGQEPKISIITPTLNCAGYIEDCIESVLSQNYANFEHIVIDGGSKDGTVPILKKYDHLKWISEPDDGEADALNKGLRMASGDIIAWLNADDYYTDGALETAAALINPAEGHHAIYGKVVLLGDDELPIGIRVPAPDVTLKRLLRWHRPLHLFQPAIFYSRELMRDVGNYCQDLTYAVDLDYWIRVARKGYQFEFVDRTFAKMRLVRKGGKTDTPYEIKEGDWLKACLPTVSTLSGPERTSFWRDYFWHRIVNAHLYPNVKFPELVDREAALGLALAAIDANAFNPAKDFISKLIKKYPDLGDLYWLLGEAHYRLRLVDDAEEMFDAAETVRLQQDEQVKTANVPKLGKVVNEAALIKRPTAAVKVPQSKRAFDVTEAAKFPFGFNVIGYVSGNLGVGVTARNVIQAIIDKGYPVAILDLDPGLGRGKYDKRYEQYVVDSPEELIYAVNLFISPLVDLHGLLESAPELLGKNRLNVSWNIWELSVVPPVWAESLQRMDALVAISDFIRHTFDFSLSGMKTIAAPPALYLPEGVRPSRERFGLPPDGTIFITSFDPFSDPVRKNPEAVVDAFERSLGQNPQAYLILKLNNAKAGGEFHPAVKALQARCEAHPRMLLFTETLDYADVLSLYDSCDVYVSLHRAEGLGLGLMEAMTLGKPVIATAWSGNMTFMDHTNSCLVGYDLIPVRGSTLAYSAEILGDSAVWADAHIDEAAAWMKRLMDDPGLREKIGKHAAQAAADFQEDARQAAFINEIRHIWDHRIATAHMLDEVSQHAVIQQADAREALVDIVIPIYGQAELLRQCVESVLATTSDVHLILVDDQSPGDEIRALFNQWKGHERMTLARTPTNQGFIGACKLGAGLGRAPFVLFLNSDTEAIEPGWLEKMIPQEKDVAIVGAKLLYPPDVPGPLAGMVQHAGVARNSNGIPYHPFLGWAEETKEVNQEREVNAVTGACYLIRRTVWDELGGWDGRFDRGVYEDVDLCWQARKQGYRVLYQPLARLYHHESASRGPDGNHSLNANTQENLAKLLEKWGALHSDEKLFFGSARVNQWRRARKHVAQAKRMLGQKNTEVALTAMEKAVKLAPDLPEALVGLAQLVAAQGDQEQATAYLAEALVYAPAHWDARLMLVDAYLANGNVAEAAKELAGIKTAFPDHPMVQERELKLAPEGASNGSSQVATETLAMLLDADDLSSALDEQRQHLNEEVLDLVRLNARTAKEDGHAELAEGLDSLAAYIEEVIAEEVP